MRNFFVFELVFAVTFLLQNSVAMPVRMLNMDPIQEGTVPAGAVVVNITGTYPIPVNIVEEIAGSDMETTIFNEYFTVESTTGIIRAQLPIDRDEIASRLGNVNSPVFFNITLFVNDASTFAEVDTVKVNLRISDINNNVPVFMSPSFPVTFSEGEANFDSARLPRATDNDEGTNSVQSYTLSSTFGGLFVLDVRRENGIITDVRLVQNGTLDAETRSNYIVNVIAAEGILNPRSATLRVNITVDDVCDVPPMFPTTQYDVTIREDAMPGSIVLSNITAMDMDSTDVGALQYEITNFCVIRASNRDPGCNSRPLNESPFNLDSERGNLRIDESIDRETILGYEISINAVDTCGQRGTATVSVTVEDVNDNPPHANIVAGNTSIKEDRLINSDFLILQVNDTDYGMDTPRFSALLYDNSSGTLRESDFFILNVEERPYIDFKLVRSLDRENTSHYSLVVNITDWGNPNISILHPLNITVIDVNDNPPVFQPYQQFITMEEELPHNTQVVHLSATDRDIEGNSRISYLLPPSNASFPYQGLFMVDGAGRLLINQTLDREQQESLTVLVEARDNPSPSNGQPLSDFAVVYINLTDINDVRPTFHPSSANVTIPENRTTNTLAFVFTASDSDTAMYSTLEYSLAPDDSPFQINSTSGHVTLERPLDYETTSRYDLTVSAFDGMETGTMNVIVLVGDVNDERCVFDRHNTYISSVDENHAPPGFLVIDINATDRDTPTDQLRFGIEAGNLLDRFRINNRTGEIFLTTSLDRENVSNYTLRISCNDGLESTEINVTVQVIDENDNIPWFVPSPLYNFSRNENLQPRTLVGTIRAVDPDHHQNGNISYIILRATPPATRSWFNLNPWTGELSTTRPLDREDPALTDGQVILLTIQAMDNPSVGSSSMNFSSVYIEIIDRNDNSPVFHPNQRNISVAENTSFGSTIYTVQAIDKDIAPNNQIYYMITPRSPVGSTDLFHINRDTGVITLNRRMLDYETQRVHWLEIVAFDPDFSNMRDTLNITINVINSPEVDITCMDFFPRVNLVENSPINHTVTEFVVADLNGTPLLNRVETIRCSIEENGRVPLDFDIRKDINSSRLIVFVMDEIDRESQGGISIRELNITVWDSRISPDSHGSVSCISTVTILDQNDNPPSFSRPSYSFDIPENNADFHIGEVSATDPDFGRNGSSGITYQISSSVPIPFEILGTGELRSTAMLDRENMSSYDFEVVAADGGPQPMTSAVGVHVEVLDLCDNPPIFSPTQNRTFVVGEETSVNTEVALLEVSDPDSGPNGEFNVTMGEVMNSHFRVYPNRSIVLIQALDRETAHSQSFTVEARDRCGKFTTADIHIIVRDYNDNAPIFNSVPEPIIIYENQTELVPFQRVTAEDDDVDFNGMVRYVIGNYSLMRTFTIDQITGDISLSRQDSSSCPTSVIDFEWKSEYYLKIVARDLAFPWHIVSKVVRIVVKPINEYAPVFDRGRIFVYVDETQTIDTEVVRISATDRDKNDRITYEVLENNQRSPIFRYDQQRQAIVNEDILVYMVRQEYNLELRARDSGGRDGTTQVLVRVNNINDHSPEFSTESTPTAGNRPIISENAPLDTIVWTVKATDIDNNTHDAVSYFLESETTPPFSIDSLTGEVKVNSSLDYELQTSYTLQIFAKDTGDPILTSTPLSLVIMITNENDEYPIFNSTDYHFSISENMPAGSFVGHVYAPDRDVGTFGDVHYSLSGSGISRYFTINRMSGILLTNATIDREALTSSEFRFTAVATDGASGSAARTAVVNVFVRVADVNDNGPEFNASNYLVYISPDVSGSVSRTRISILDHDEASNSRNQLEVDIPAGNIPINVSISSGELRLNEPVPSNYLPVYYYTLRTFDSRNSTFSDSARLELIVESENDHHPRFSEDTSPVVPVREIDRAGTEVFQVSSIVTDRDTGTNGVLSYALEPNYPEFAINDSSGLITLQRMLDFESVKRYQLTVLATDGAHRTATGTVIVTVLPGNEFSPRFNRIPTHLTLSYLPRVGLDILSVMATDDDQGTDGNIHYNAFGPFFVIDQEKGILRNQVVLETDHPPINLTIGAYDGASPSLTANTTILITIRDAGESSTPTFVPSSSVTYDQQEDLANGSFINNALSTTPPADSFHIVNVSRESEIFSISESDGRLRILHPLDYERTTSYIIIVEARKETGDELVKTRSSSYLEVTLTVRNVNEYTPVFSDIQDQSFNESTLVNTHLFTVHAIDGDDGPEGTLSYNFVQGHSVSTFRIDSTSGDVFLNQPLDRETVSSYDLRIRAQDLSHDNPLSSTITVHITVTDVNDFAPTYGGRNYSIRVYEYDSTQPGDRIIKLAATDEDLGPPLIYNLELISASLGIQDQDISGLGRSFLIDHNGVVIVGDQTYLDRELIDNYVLRITARDRDHTNVAETYLTIEILDINDRTPVITGPGRRIDINERQPVGTIVTNGITATDEDSGINSWLRYSLIPSPGTNFRVEDYFRIDPLSGVIRTNSVLVARNTSSLSFQCMVMVEDQGINRKRASKRIHIWIRDLNDHAPVFESESITLRVSRNARVGTHIHKFRVTDSDLGVNSSPGFDIPGYYREVHDNFRIGSGDGNLILHREQQETKSYNFIVRVNNPSFTPSCAQYAQSSSINVTVIVTPVNTQAPRFTQLTYSVQVAENIVSEDLIEIMANDTDGDEVMYSIRNSTTQALAINPRTGFLSLRTPLDREENSTHSLYVLATDNGFPVKARSALVSVTVLDMNDNPPVFHNLPYNGEIRENSPANYLIQNINVAATDGDLGENGTVFYKLAPNNSNPFRIDRRSGQISATVSLDFESTMRYSFDIIAYDGGRPSESATATVTIAVQGVNEVAPKFINLPVNPIPVDMGTTRGGRAVYVLNATDGDQGTQLIFYFEDTRQCYLSINRSTGAIYFRTTSSAESCFSRLTKESDSEYYIMVATVIVSDGSKTNTSQLRFRIHQSLIEPIQEPTPPLEIIMGSVAAVLFVIFVFLIVLIVACVCRAKRHYKVRINDTDQTYEMRKRFGSGRSGSHPPAPIYKQTSVGSLPPEHMTMNVTQSNGSGTSSARQSYYGADIDTSDQDKISYPSPSTTSRKSQLSRPYRSTSDLGSSTVATEMLSSNSQEAAPYTKSQMEKIFAKNADLLDHSGSNESIHMFGSEGGGESDGGDDMLFAKLNDLDDDDDSTTMQDDDDERSYDRSMPNSRENLNVPPTDIIDDPYQFDHSSSAMKWAPRVNDMADTINEIAMSNYDSEDPMRRGGHYMDGFMKSQEGMSMYGASTQESTRPLLRHNPHTHHPQSRIPQHLLQLPEYYGTYDEMVPDHEHHAARVPKYSSSNGLPMHSSHDLPRGHHPNVGRHGMNIPEEVPMYGYHGDFMHHPMHHEIEGTDSGSSSTPTEGTMTTRALTNDYESDDITYSSDTSINTNTESDHPQMRAFSQRSQRHPYH